MLNMSDCKPGDLVRTCDYGRGSFTQGSFWWNGRIGIYIGFSEFVGGRGALYHIVVIAGKRVKLFPEEARKVT